MSYAITGAAVMAARKAPMPAIFVNSIRIVCLLQFILRRRAACGETRSAGKCSREFRGFEYTAKSEQR